MADKPEDLLSLGVDVLRLKFTTETKEDVKNIKEYNQQMAENALRVLALAYKPISKDEKINENISKLYILLL